MRRASGRALLGAFGRLAVPSNPVATMIQNYSGQGTVGSVASTSMTTTFTPAAGELIVMKCMSWKGTVIFNTPTATGLTFTRTVPATNASSASPSVTLWTTTIPAGVAGTSVTITNPVQNQSSGTGYYALSVQRWNGLLGSTPNYNILNAVTTSPYTIGLSATSFYSMLTWAAIDANAVTPSGVTYSGTPVLDFAPYQSAGSYTSYSGYQPPTQSAGATTQVGVTAPSGQKVAAVALEILAPAA